MYECWTISATDEERTGINRKEVRQKDTETEQISNREENEQQNGHYTHNQEKTAAI